MFTNPCVGTIEYEATTSAFVMAGIFVSFLIEYAGHRIVVAKANRDTPDLPSSTSDGSGELASHGSSVTKEGSPASNGGLAALGHHHGNPFSPTNPNSKLSVMVMEAGVLFHSILIGVTLVVAGDSFYRTLLVVIIFHQMFEGLALGARIALIRNTSLWPTKFVMGLAFALITPLGMAIGISVLNQFNGNDPTTLWVIGVLDAVSAGILIWVGLVDMWARDWVVEGGDMVDAGLGRLGVGMFSLLSGMVVMSVLGKWA
jgi:solute carrier family 39 (zinc transporter), member 1/2/3